MLSCLVLLLCLLVLPVQGQESRPVGDGLDEVLATTRESMPWQLPVMTVEEEVEIDGVLDESLWKKAGRIRDFRQVEPIAGAAPSEKTEVLILHSADYLYLGIRCLDRNPEGIIATQMVRDGRLRADDFVRFIVDTYNDKRNAFVFEINAAGARVDGLLENSSNFNRDWDGIWYGRARIDESGWTAEIALPMKTLNFDPHGSTWGFNVERFIRRRNELLRWASPSQDTRLFDVGRAGILTELEGLEQGLGLDIKTSLSLRYLKDDLHARDVFNYEPSVDIFYKITPDLTAAFTANTDFAETEVDERRVNLTRFPLFFPEKRDFFLQDAGIFRFGGIRNDPLPFFSRRIGISANGQPVDILAGIKLTGRIQDLNIGVLDVQTRSFDQIDSRNLGVARLKYNVFEESSVGIIATAGDPTTNNSNYLAGVDFNYRSSRIFGGRILTGAVFYQKSFAEGSPGEDASWGARLRYPNDTFFWSAGYVEVQKNYDPGLGFSRRRDIREYFGNIRLRHRPESWIRTIEHNVRWFLVTTRDNVLETGSLTVNPIEVATEDGDGLQLIFSLNREFLFSPFQISRGVTIPAGTYSFFRWGFRLESSRGRELSGRARVLFGGFYEGSRRDLDLSVEWRPSRHLFLSMAYVNNKIDLDFGHFQTHIARLRLNLVFTPDISWNTFVQYDNVSRLMGINSRFRWIIEPGREFFFVVNQGFLIENDRFQSTSTDLTVKLSWTFRF